MITWLKKLFSNNKPEVEADPKKYLIVGLGNIGSEYDDTRHNVGFEIIDLLAKENDLVFKSGGNGFTTTLQMEDRTFILLKPTTYVNLSGKAVRYWMKKEKIYIENLLILIDDLNIPYGKLRLRGKGSDGGHNGLKHINEVLGSNKYARLRFGIGNEFGKGKQVNYVLGKWSEEELERLSDLLNKAAEMVKGFGTIGLANTMSKFNN